MREFSMPLITDIQVGSGFISKVGKCVKKYSNKVLLVYGGGSIKANGIYDEVLESLQKSKIEVIELSGIVSNPLLSKVNEGINICRKNNINFILPVGGGSVWDTSKAIASGVNYDGDVWDFFEGKNIPSALPHGGVFTMSATSTESNCIAVVTNDETREKTSIYSEWIRPKFAISDPKVISTIPKNILLYGAFDIISHLLEGYFDREVTPLLDSYSIVTIKHTMDIMKTLSKNQNDVNASYELLYAGAFGHSGILYCGRGGGDWASHKLEHVISGFFPEIIHGEGLAIVFPAWMTVVNHNQKDKFDKLFSNIFVVPNDEDPTTFGIKKLKEFLVELGLPISLKGSRVEKDFLLDKYKELLVKYKAIGQAKILDESDMESIVEEMYL